MKLHVLNCDCCGTSIGYQFREHNANDMSEHKMLCYLCTHSICDLVQEKSIWGGKPDKHNLYHLEKGRQHSINMRSNFLRNIESIRRSQ